MGVSSYLLCAKYSAKMRIKMDKILEKWDEILSTVKHEHDISDISFDTWIRPLEVYGVEGSTLYILVPSEQMTLSYISKKILSSFKGNDCRTYGDRIRNQVHPAGTDKKYPHRQ